MPRANGLERRDQAVGAVAGLKLAYELLDIRGRQAPASHREMLALFDQWGLETCPLNRTAEDLEAVRAYRQEMGERRDTLDYEVDGIVIKVDDRALRSQLGVRARSPRWVLAWKFEPREEVTTLEVITVQVGRTGILTPIALLQPVDVGGVTVSRATLHDAGEIRRKDIRPGDRVRVIRAGDVIPEIAERIPPDAEGAGEGARSERFRMPDTCPACGTATVREGGYWLCPAGLSCTAQLIGRIEHFAARDALDIEGLGVETARQLVERGLVATLADLYRISKEDLACLDGFAEKSATKLERAIQDSRKPPLDRFLYALGIRHVGRRIARLLVDASWRRLSSSRQLRSLCLRDRGAMSRRIFGPQDSGQKPARKGLGRTPHPLSSLRTDQPDPARLREEVPRSLTGTPKG